MQTEVPEGKITEKLQSYDEIELISQGAYGCVFRPDIPCDKSLTPNKKYISKIQLKNSNVKSEFIIGEQIQTIPLYYLHFAPILSKCVVSIQQIKQSEIEKCEILKDLRETEPALISTKIKYVGNKNIENYFLTLLESPSQLKLQPPQKPQIDTNEKELIEENIPNKSNTESLQQMPRNIYKSKLLYCFYYVLQSAKILNEKGIIHFDIKEQNIIYNEYIQAPILIDFGLSFIPETTNEEEMFYTKLFYAYWCIEIYILSYIVNRTREEIGDRNIKITPSKFDLENNNVTEIKINELLRTYQEGMNAFFGKYMNKQFTKEEIQKYTDSMKSYLMQYNGTSWNDNVYQKLFIPQMYNTWDIYSIAITFSCILNYHLTQENMEEYKYFIDILKSIILSLPNERPDYNKIMEML